jgi:hypothetical protein
VGLALSLIWVADQPLGWVGLFSFPRGAKFPQTVGLALSLIWVADQPLGWVGLFSFSSSFFFFFFS